MDQNFCCRSWPRWRRSFTHLASVVRSVTSLLKAFPSSYPAERWVRGLLGFYYYNVDNIFVNELQTMKLLHQVNCQACYTKYKAAQCVRCNQVWTFSRIMSVHIVICQLCQTFLSILSSISKLSARIVADDATRGSWTLERRRRTWWLARSVAWSLMNYGKC